MYLQDAQTVAALPNLLALDVSDTELNDAALAALGAGLPRLQELTISDNNQVSDIWPSFSLYILIS